MRYQKSIQKRVTPTNWAMNSQYDNFTQKANSKIKWSRQEVAKGVVDFLSRKHEISQREFGKETGIPCATIQNWVRRHNTMLLISITYLVFIKTM